MFSKFIEFLFWKTHKIDYDKNDFDAGDEASVYMDLSEVKELRDLWKFYLKRDKDRYFKAGDDRLRNITRGQYIRTLYQLRKLSQFFPKADDEVLKTSTKKSVDTKISGRYD